MSPCYLTALAEHFLLFDMNTQLLGLSNQLDVHLPQFFILRLQHLCEFKPQKKTCKGRGGGGD
jgi:hypothetical protein